MVRRFRLHSGGPTPARVGTIRETEVADQKGDLVTDTQQVMAGPLHGIRVVELGVWVAGPAAGGILADWGADVIKIEAPEGDPARRFTRMLGGDLPTNPPFELDNRGKRSVVLDLRTPQDLARALDLIESADVFLTNIRKAALHRIGLDPQTLLDRNDQLIYALITGLGIDGPDSDKAAYDVAAWWSRAGIAALLTAPGSDPPFQRGGMGDHTVAMTAAAMVSSALVARQTTGKGQLVTTSLLRQGAYTIGFDLNVYLLWGHQIAIGARTAMGNPAMNNYTAADGRRFWIVGLDAVRHWPALVRAVGRPEWLEGHRYSTPAGRFQHASELIAELDAIFATKPLEEWTAIFERDPEFFWAPVNTLEDLVADPQFHAAGGLVEVPSAESTLPMVANPVDFHGTPYTPRRTAPALGEHTEEILQTLRSAPRHTNPPQA
jgi:crotonobetainyl-CoA:carnitine CoA-transferase CaiB-like acyl-CoA transferase